jgi:hypothetical protein
MLNFRGTSLEQDSRFGDRDKKLEGKIKFPAEFDTKVHGMAAARGLLLLALSDHRCATLVSSGDPPPTRNNRST